MLVSSVSTSKVAQLHPNHVFLPPVFLYYPIPTKAAMSTEPTLQSRYPEVEALTLSFLGSSL